MMRPPMDQTLWNAAGMNRGDYDSMFAPRPDGQGPGGPNGMGFGALPSRIGDMGMEQRPGAQSNMPIIGPEVWNAIQQGGLLSAGGPQQQQQGLLPNRLSLTPQMIEQITRQMARPQAAPPMAQQQQQQAMEDLEPFRRSLKLRGY